MTRRLLDELACAVCGMPVDLGWALRTGRTMHIPCQPAPAPQQPPAPRQPATGRVTSLADLGTDGDPTDDLDWQAYALCAQTDPETFFPEKGGSTRAAKAVCQSCEVREQCLRHALDNDERFGIWGGLSERERRRVKRDSNDPDDDQDDDEDEPGEPLAEAS